MTQTSDIVWESSQQFEHSSTARPDAAESAATAAVAAASAAMNEDEERLRRRCQDLSCASAHMRRGNPALAEPLYRRVLADVIRDDLNGADESAGNLDDRLAFGVEARLGLVEIDLTRLRDESASSATADANDEEAVQRLLVRCRLLLRALSHAHAAQDALNRSGLSRRRLQLRLLLGSVDIKRRLMEARLQGLLRQAVAGGSGGSRHSRPRVRRLSQSGGEVSGGGAGICRGQGGSSFCHQEKRPAFSGAAVKRSPSLQQRHQQQQLQRNRRRQRNASTLAEFVRQLRDFLVARADAEKAAAAAAAVTAATTSATVQTEESAKRPDRAPSSDPDKISVQQLDSLIGRFVEDSLQHLKDTLSPPRDLVVSSLRRDESGEHYLQFSRHYLTFAQSLVGGSGLRDDMEAAASGLLGDIRRQQLDLAMMEMHRKLDGPSATLPVTGRERAAARLAHLPQPNHRKQQRQMPSTPPPASTTVYDDKEVAGMLKTLLRSLLDIAQAALDTEQLLEAVELFEACLDLCRSLSREVGDTEVERYEAPKIHRLLGAIHCRLGDRRRGVSMMIFAADLFEQRLRETTPVDDEDADDCEKDGDDEDNDDNSGESGTLGLAETWYDIGCVLIGASGDGRCGDQLLNCLSEQLRQCCLNDLLLQLLSSTSRQQPQSSKSTDAADALKAFSRCRDLLACVAKQKRRKRRQPPALMDVEVRVTARLADCCFLAGRLKRAQAHYEEALALLGGAGDVPQSGGGSVAPSSSGGGRMIDHGHVLRMIGCSRLLLANNRSQAAAVLETALIMFQHLAKVNHQTPLADEDKDDAGSWDREQLWVLTPLLACHLASGHHPRALHCSRLILTYNDLASSTGQRWLTFYANFAAGRTARRLRDFSASARYLELAVTAARRGSDECFGGSVGVGRLLACLAEAEAAEAAADDKDSSDDQVASHYARLLQYLDATTNRPIQQHQSRASALPLRCPALSSACLRGAELLQSAGRHEDCARLLEAAARCSAVEDMETAEGLSRRLAELGLALGTAAMRAGQWDRALSHLKGALAACARNQEGEVGPEGAPILARLGALHHALYCLARRDILFEHTEVQDSQDRCAFNYLQSLQLAWSPNAALRLAGFLLATGQTAEAERYAQEVENIERDHCESRIEIEAYEAPTLLWGLEAVWPLLSTPTPPTLIRPRRGVLAEAILASCGSIHRGCVVNRLRKLLTFAINGGKEDEADDRLLASLAMLHHGLAWEAAFLLSLPEDSVLTGRAEFLRVWCADLTIVDLAVAMVTAFCCLLHLTNALAAMRSSMPIEEKDESLDGESNSRSFIESTRL